MYKKIFVFGLLLCILILAGCKEKYPEEEIKCRFNHCGGLDLDCSFGGIVYCPAVDWPGSVCRVFAKCQEEDGECKMIKSDAYDECNACFKACERQNTWDNCTQSCRQKYEKIWKGS